MTLGSTYRSTYSSTDYASAVRRSSLFDGYAGFSIYSSISQGNFGLSYLWINFLICKIREFYVLLDTNCKFWHLAYSVPAIFCVCFACEIFFATVFETIEKTEEV